MNDFETTRIHRTRRQQRIERMLAGFVLAGGFVATVAVLWPSQDDLRIPPAHAETITTTAKIPEAPAPVAKVAKVVKAEPSPTEIAPAATVEGKRPLVAIAHDDEETDFEARALAELSLGEQRAAFDDLRMHIYKREPTAEILLRIGRIGRQLGELAVAEQALLDAAALEPRNAEVQVETARVHLDANDLKAARHAARQAIRLDKEYAPAWNVAGRVALQESDWSRAEAAFRRAVELAPTDAMVHNNLGLLYIHMKHAEDAVDSLETSVELFDSDVPYYVHNNLGLAYEMARMYEDARDAFEQALVANPDYSRARVNLKRVLAAIEKDDGSAPHERRVRPGKEPVAPEESEAPELDERAPEDSTPPEDTTPRS